MLTATLSLNDSLFGGDAAHSSLSWGQLAARAAIVYVAGILLVRLGKSRMLGRASPLDVIVAFILGSMLSRAITGTAAITDTLVATASLVLLHATLTWLACRFHACGWLIKGRPHVLVQDGQINWANMHHSHISEADLREEMRLNANVTELAAVELAVKERSGQIGVVRKPLSTEIEIAVQDGVQTVRIILTHQ